MSLAGRTPPSYLLLGCGYTASRVALSLIASGARVICTNRNQRTLPGAECVPLDLAHERGLRELLPHLTPAMRVLHSIPTASASLLDQLRQFEPSRMLYLSTTGVYGPIENVNETTTPQPESKHDQERLQAEQLIANGAWATLILRPAAIYGPHRGVHTRASHGVFRPPPGGNRLVSRIHVDDLAAHVVAGLRSEVTGAFPVADGEPCSSLELAEWTAGFAGVTLQAIEGEANSRDQTKRGRQVDGSAIRRLLDVRLQYPSFRQGVPACLKAERTEAPF